MQKAIIIFIMSCFICSISYSQDFYLEITTEECEGYVYACVEPFSQEVGLIEWEIDGMLYESDTLDNCFEIYLGPGVYNLTATLYDWNGNVILHSTATGEITEYLEETIYIFEGGFIELTSNAEMICPDGNSSGCEKVCEFATVIYTLQSEFPGGNQEVSWNVIGASSWQEISAEQIEVIWGESGSGQVEVISITGSNCFSTAFICVEIIDSPIAAFSTSPQTTTGILNICQGQEVSFLNESSSSVYYEWYFGDGASSSEANPEHTYNFDGDFEVQLIARNECLCSDTSTLLVHVEPLQSPFIACVGTICELDTITYTSDADCSTFLWTISSNGEVISGGGSTDNFVDVYWNGGHVGNIELSVDNCNGDYCLSPAMIQVPIMSGNPQIQGIERVCKGAVETYLIQDYSATYYNWTITGGTVLSGQGSNEISVEWNSPAQLPMDGLVQVDYENCYLECTGSDEHLVKIVDDFIITGAIETCPDGIVEYKSINVFSQLPVSANWELKDAQNNSLWSFANTSVVNVPFPNTPGTYMLEIVAVDSDDYCNDRYQKIISVSEKSTPPLAIDGEKSICPGSSYQYLAVSSKPDNQFNWYVNNGGAMETYEGNPVVISWAASGPYELSVTQTDFEVFPCESDPYSEVIQEIPTITLSGNSSACDQEIATYSTEFIEYANYAWEITPADIAVITGETDKNQIEVQWLKAGAATLSVSLCGQQASTAVTIHALPEPLVVHPAELCENEQATLAVANTYTDYKWYDDSRNLISSDAAPMVFPGSYELVVTDGNGCTGNMAFTIEVLPIPNIRISTPDDTGICLTDGDRYPELYALDSDYGYTWQWYKDGVPMVGETGPIIKADAFAFYYVEVVDVKGCKNISNTIEVFEWCNECKGGTCSGGSCNLDYCNNPGGIFDFDHAAGAECNEIVFTNLSTNTEPGSINWNFGDEAVSNDFSTDFNPTFSYSNAGFYEVLMTGYIEDLDNPGSYCFIWRSEIVTVPAAAKFDIDKACPGEATQFYDLSTFLPGEDILSWQWNFGDPSSLDNVSTDQEPTHVYDAAGSYTVSLEISTATCISTYSRVVDVYPLPEISIFPPSVSCAGTAIEFAGESLQYVVEWNWDFGDAASGDLNFASAQNSFHQYDSPGVYTVQLSAENIYGCTEVITEMITIEPNLLTGQIASDKPNPLCEGGIATLTAPAGGVSWAWSTGEASESIAVSEADLYSVTLTDTEGCSYTPDDYQLVLIPKPINTIRSVVYNEYDEPILYNYGQLEICEEEEVHLEIIQQEVQFYQWSSGQTGTSIEYNVDGGEKLGVGTHEFIVTITDNITGCENAIGPFEVIVHALPDNISISSNPSGFLCGGETVTISVDAPNSDFDYIWSNGNLGTEITTDMAGSYFVTAVNDFGCSQESEKIEIHKGPDLGFIPDGCLERCLPDTVCLPTIPGVVSYQWFFNGVEMPGEITSDLVIEEEGEYHVVLTDVNGCTSTSDPFSVEQYFGTGTVETYVFFDENLDGDLDPGDTPLDSIMVYLEGIGTSFLDSMLTDINGHVQWFGVPDGTYLLSIDSLALEEIGLKAYDYEIIITVDGCDEGGGEPPYFLTYPSCAIAYEYDSEEYCYGIHYYNGIEITQDTIVEFSVVDSDGCETITSVDIRVFDEITFDVDVIKSCFQEDNGSVSISNISGGNGNYTSYLDGALFGSSVTGLTVNSYTIKVEDGMGCFSEQVIQVEEFPELSLSFDMFPSCFNEDNGGIEITQVIEPNSTVYLDNVAIDPSEFQNLPADTYVIRLENEHGCSVEESVTIDENPELVLELDSEESCPESNTGVIHITNMVGGSGVLTATIDGEPIVNNEVPELEVGFYTILLEDENACTVETTIEVEATPELVYSIEVPVLNCDEESDLIEILSTDPSINIEWDDGSTDPIMEIDNVGMYQVSISNDCETVVEQVSVETELTDDPEIYIPNIFSPNGDGQNDGFHVMMNEHASLEDAELCVMDRWGEMIYKSDDPKLAWDGMYRGREIQPGVYVVMFKGTLDYCHIKKEHKVHSEITIVK